MQKSEKAKFFKILRDLFLIYGKDPDRAVYEMWFKIMEEYDPPNISKAFGEYAKNEKFPPVPAGVIEYLPKKLEISANEAWAHVPKSENEGAWLNSRMSSALSQVSGLTDMVAARMSFISAYNNLPDDGDWFYSRPHNTNYEKTINEKDNSQYLLMLRGWIEKPDNFRKPLGLEVDHKNIKKIDKDSARRNIEKLKNILTGVNSNAEK